MKTKKFFLVCSVAFLSSGFGTARAETDSTAKQLDTDDYQSFVGNWTPETQPLCAVLQSADDWNRILHPAATMGANKPYAPPGDLWNGHAVLILAHVIGAGDTTNVFKLQGVARTTDKIDVNVQFTPTPPASSTMKWYLAVEVAEPLASQVRFLESGKVVCSVDLANAASPKLPK